MERFKYISLRVLVSMIVAWALVYLANMDLWLAWWLRKPRVTVERRAFLVVLCAGMVMVHARTRRMNRPALRVWGRLGRVALMGALSGFLSSLVAWQAVSALEGHYLTKLQGSLAVDGALGLSILIGLSTLGWFIGLVAAVTGNLSDSCDGRRNDRPMRSSA